MLSERKVSSSGPALPLPYLVPLAVAGGALALSVVSGWLLDGGQGLSALFGIVYLLATDWLLVALMGPPKSGMTAASCLRWKLAVGGLPIALSVGWLALIAVRGDIAWMALPVALAPLAVVAPVLVISLLMPK